MRHLGLVAWLTILWLVLWRDATVANAVSGLLVAIVVTSAFPGTRGDPPRHRVRPLWLIGFFAYFHWKMVEANFVLAREILTPRDHTLSGIIAVPAEGLSDRVVTLIANAITLTPGTVTLEIRRDPTTLYVHVLHLHDTERVRRDVRRLQELALRASGADHPVPSHPDQEAR